MDAIVPLNPADLAGNELRATEVLMGGLFAGAEEEVRDCVGCNHEEWRVYSQPSGPTVRWNLGAMFVREYLKDVPAAPAMTEAAPSGLGLDVIEEPRSLLDFHDICLAVASNWRRNPFAPEFWRAVRHLEQEVGAAIDAECPSPDLPNVAMAIDICGTLGYLWALEYLQKKVLPPDVEEMPELAGEGALETWIATERERALMAKIAMKRPIVGACVFPGELELYARCNGGIFASDLSTAVEDTRPYVAHKALVEAAEDLDLSLGCGVVVMHLVNRFLLAALHFPWVTHNVHIDVEFMGNARHRDVCHRTQPWILLLGNQWHVIHRARAWHSTSPYRTVLMWWQCFLEEAADGHFRAGWEEWDLGHLEKFPPQ